MTREINNDNSDKGTIQGGRDGGTPYSVRVVRNTTVQSNFANAALWLNRMGEGNGYYDIYGLDEARKLYDAIGEVLADYDQLIEDEALTGNSRLLNSLPIGSVIQVNNETTRWYKKRLGWVTRPDNDYAQAAFWFDDHDWTITVKYNPEED